MGQAKKRAAEINEWWLDPIPPVLHKQAVEAAESGNAIGFLILQEILVIANQDELDQVRMVQKINVDPSGAIVKDVSVVFSPTTKYG